MDPEQMLKQALTKIGRRTSTRTIHRLNAALDFLEVGRWLHARGFDTSERVATRNQLFLTAATALGPAALYLEFGVWQGASMREWSRLLSGPDAHLQGFDTFVGRPDAWNIAAGVGAFSTEGGVPEIDDPRVEFFAGLFGESLGHYPPPPHDIVVREHRLCRLPVCEDRPRPGRASAGLRSFLYFDEFSDRAHELRAFERAPSLRTSSEPSNEFLGRTRYAFRLVGSTRTWRRCCSGGCAETHPPATAE